MPGTGNRETMDEELEPRNQFVSRRASRNWNRLATTSWFVKRTERELGAALGQALSDLGITAAQFGVLEALAHLERATSADLARAVFVTPQAMTGILAGLERQNLVIRAPIRSSSRIINVWLSPAGRHVFKAASERVLHVEQDLVSRLSPAEHTTLADLLARCVEGLQGGGAMDSFAKASAHGDDQP